MNAILEFKNNFQSVQMKIICECCDIKHALPRQEMLTEFYVRHRILRKSLRHFVFCLQKSKVLHFFCDCHPRNIDIRNIFYDLF